MSGGTGAVNSRLLLPGQPGAGREGQAGAGTAFRWERVCVLEYPPVPEAVPSARLRARQALRGWGLDEVADDGLVALCELLTNAVTASANMPSRPTVRVRLLADPGQLIIEVFDRAGGVPEIKSPAWDEDGGRGLVTVAGLARRWGWTRHLDGKIVWCDFWL
jgi:anti-sigma regulatory factor (Ser/Thr protein kinase)